MPAPTGLIFVDSFDHYNSLPLMQRKWTVAAMHALVTGRSGSGQALEYGATYGTPQLTFGWNYPTITYGVAYKTTSFSNAVFYGNGLGLSSWSLLHVGDGRLALDIHFHSNSGPFPGFVMSLNTWYYIEMKVTITSNLYTYELRVNNSVIATGALASTTFGTSPLGTQSISFLGPGGGLLAYIDDLYVTDGDFLGDANWGVIYPNAPGDAADFTPHPAVANWNNTKEHSPDDFTSYNQADTIGNQDLYNMDDLGGSFKIVGIHALNCATKIAAGVASFDSSIKTNSTLVQEPEWFPSFGSWQYQRKGYEVNPVTGVAWTAAEINAIQRGALRIT